MKEIKIEHLVYLLKQAKDKNEPQPIFFLGAGASRSGQIPLANEIIAQILRDYSDSPFIKDIAEKDRTYAKLMDCLLPAQRDELLKNYIANAKINVTHIYLAQLINEGYVDYVLTVNFDNLMLRALALYNIFPSTYDMAILKDFTTSTFKEKSVVYLHGQNHGLWLLNTAEEMKKVENTVPRIFDSIKNKRPWIFMGYSGEDPIFKHIKSLGRFDNGLYWIAYKENNPNENVQQFLAHSDTNAFIIKGFDSDSFMLKLNKELGLAQPTIVDKPFTALQDMLQKIVDIDEQEHFKGVKERLEISKRQVKEAIQQFELGKVETEEQSEINHDDLLKKQIINLIIEEDYDTEAIAAIEAKVSTSKDSEVQSLFAELLFNWGNASGDLANNTTGKEAEALYQQAFEKYGKATEIKPDKHEAYNNWGNALGELANITTGKEAEDLYQQAIEKYGKAIEIKPDKHEAYNNWGVNLGALAKTSKEAEDLYQQASEKYSKAIEIKPDYYEAYFNWGYTLVELAKTGKEAEDLYQQAIEKYSKAIKVKSDYHEAYNNWGNALGELAKTKTGKEAEDLYQQVIEKYDKAIEIKPDYYEAYYNWGNTLVELAKTGKEAEDLLQVAIEKYSKAIEIKPGKYKAYYNWGNALVELAKTGKEADNLYQQAIEKYDKAIEIKPDFHEAYYNWGYTLVELAKTKTGKEAEDLYQEALKKYSKAIEIRPDFRETYYKWGYTLVKLAKTKTGKEAEDLYQEAIEKYDKAIVLGGSSYNLACLYAIQGKLQEALFYLDKCLANNEISVDFVQSDEDWESYSNNNKYLELLHKYRNTQALPSF